MFRSLRRIFSRRPGTIYEAVDHLNVELHGGPPTIVSKQLGTLPIPSRSIMLHDPQEMPRGLVIPQLASDLATIQVQLRLYPDGSASLVELTIELVPDSTGSADQLAGEIGIDSAKLVVADTEEARAHWSETGADRVGVISTLRGQKIHKQLKQKFRLKTRQIDSFRAETLSPVDEALEREIEAYLETVPECAEYPSIHFHVRTNSSFERVNFMEGNWEFLPIGNAPQPVMFACLTGRGDGCYPVRTTVEKGEVVSVRVDFMDDAMGREYDDTSLE